MAVLTKGKMDNQDLHKEVVKALKDKGTMTELDNSGYIRYDVLNKAFNMGLQVTDEAVTNHIIESYTRYQEQDNQEIKDEFQTYVTKWKNAKSVGKEEHQIREVKHMNTYIETVMLFNEDLANELADVLNRLLFTEK